MIEAPSEKVDPIVTVVASVPVGQGQADVFTVENLVPNKEYWWLCRWVGTRNEEETNQRRMIAARIRAAPPRALGKLTVSSSKNGSQEFKAEPVTSAWSKAYYIVAAGMLLS